MSNAPMNRWGIATIGFLAFTSLAQVDAQQSMLEQNALYHDVSTIPLGKIKPIILESKGKRRENLVHRLTVVETKGIQKDPAVQMTSTRILPILEESFEGLGQGLDYESPVTPPDTTGAVGKKYFIEWVNQALVIFDKQTKQKVYGPTDGSTIWSNFAPKGTHAHACAESNDGDPIVLYDRISDRWILSQFAHSEGAPYLQCIAVSTTDDPLGTYSRYAFKFNYFNDYGKLAIWPDGYYASFNMFDGTARDAPPKGSEACVFDRVSMLNGRNARMVCFALKETGLLAADMDGNRLPPASSPEYFVGLGTNRLSYWKFHVDWSNTKNSTMSLPLDVSDVPSFVSGCTVDTCDFVPQKDSDSMLDTMGDRLMYRLAYRNFGDHEALVVNHSVRVPGPENQNAGVFAFRWYEIRPFKAGLKVQQRGTFRPSGISRWMASMAMDKLGDIAIGYSASGPDEYPSAYYTGRLANETDPNALGQEKRLWAGSGSQTRDAWGDYTTMTVDPDDDCTLWFVSQYLQKEDANIWHTRISTLRFQGCQ